MKTFAAIVTKHKAAKHRIPAGQGWKTRQQVARELGVNTRDLRSHLADAIAAKDIEEKKFSEWDAAAMKAIPVTCYRIVEKAMPKSAPKELSVTISWPPAEGTRVARKDKPTNQGTYIGKGKVHWDSGATTQPKGSTIKKIILAI